MALASDRKGLLRLSIDELKLLLLGICYSLALNLRGDLFEVLVSELHCLHLEVVFIFLRHL